MVATVVVGWFVMVVPVAVAPVLATDAMADFCPAIVLVAATAALAATVVRVTAAVAPELAMVATAAMVASPCVIAFVLVVAMGAPAATGVPVATAAMGVRESLWTTRRLLAMSPRPSRLLRPALLR